jgi:hypothetical protein
LNLKRDIMVSQNLPSNGFFLYRYTTEALLLIDLRARRLVREVVIPSHFTHDAVRAGDTVFLADTGGGHVLELSLPDLERGAVRSAEFTFKEHVNTLAPAGLADKPHAVWALLHNLGPSKLVLADLATGERLREIPGVGSKAHGLVPWEGGFIILNSGEGQLCKFTPPREDEGPEARGQLDVLWSDTQKTFMKGLTVVESVAYFGIAEFGDRSTRDSRDKTAEVAAFDLRSRRLLWRETVETRGLLNVVAAPHVAEWSTYRPVETWSWTPAKAWEARTAAAGAAGAAGLLRGGHSQQSQQLQPQPQPQRAGGGGGREHAAEAGGPGVAPSGVRWMDLRAKERGNSVHDEDLLIQHGPVDVSELKAWQLYKLNAVDP